MLSSTAVAFSGFAGWLFVPDLATRFLIDAISRIPPSLLPRRYTPPRPGTPAYALHYRIVFSVGVLGYLLYTLYAAYTASAPNFYRSLGLPVGGELDEQALKTAFRSHARRHHPDRAGSAGEAQFVELREAFEALKHPVKRFAYDRFGPTSLEWPNCSTMRDYVFHGINSSLGFYIGSGGLMLLLAIFSGHGHAAYWRYFLWGTLFAIELSLLLLPPSGLNLPRSATPLVARALDALFPHRTPHQHILFLHQLFTSLSMAITRVAPIMFFNANSSEVVQGRIKQAAAQLNTLSQLADREVTRMLAAELRALHGPQSQVNSNVPPTPSRSSSSTRVNGASPSKAKRGKGKGKGKEPAVEPTKWEETIMSMLEHEMENMLIDVNIRRHPMLGSLWKDAVDREQLAWEQQSRQQQQLGLDKPGEPQAPPQPSLPSPPASVTPLPDASGIHGSPPPQLEPTPPPDFSSLGMAMKRSSSYRSRSLSY